MDGPGERPFRCANLGLFSDVSGAVPEGVPGRFLDRFPAARNNWMNGYLITLYDVQSKPLQIRIKYGQGP